MIFWRFQVATYQFKFEFLPRGWAVNNKFDVKIFYDDNVGADQYDLSIAWENFIFSNEIDSLISKILPKNQSWDTDLLVWGNEEQSDIKVWLDDKKLESLTIRLDLRNKIEILLNNIIELAMKRIVLYLYPKQSR